MTLAFQFDRLWLAGWLHNVECGDFTSFDGLQYTGTVKSWGALTKVRLWYRTGSEVLQILTRDMN